MRLGTRTANPIEAGGESFFSLRSGSRWFADQGEREGHGDRSYSAAVQAQAQSQAHPG